MRNTTSAWVLLVCVAGVQLPAQAQDEVLDLGGAARFNYAWRDYGPSEGNGEADLELLRLEADGGYGPLFYSAQYRWYEDFEAVHHAWLGVRFDAQRDLRAGVTKVPFGLLPYASHSFWFGSGYYLGLEDDYDLGAVYQRKSGDDSWHLGLFFGDEYGTGTDYDRYSFDLASTDALPYRERERLHLRYAHALSVGPWTGEAGLSGFGGRFEHRPSADERTQWGLAAHLEMARGPLSAQLQWAHYDYDVPGHRIALSAFRFPFEIAAKADIYTFNLAYELPRTAWFDSITCYNDLSTTQASGSGLDDSVQNVSGCSFGKGVLFGYVDWIAGRSMWFVGGPGVGLAEPGGQQWRSRLNVNVGIFL